MPSSSSTLKTANWKLSQAVKHLKPSATLWINERSKALIREGKKVYRLGFGQSPFPVPTEVVEALKDHAHIKDYLPGKGLFELREAVATHLNQQHQLNYKTENILVGPGSKELIFNAQLALDATLLLPSPSWVSYEPQSQLIGRKNTWINTSRQNNWCLQASDLERICQDLGDTSKILILNYPNNPTGTSYSTDQLNAIANVARENGILIIADEIYGLTHFKGQHRSIAEFYPEGTIVSTGLSKWAGAGGWRLGVFAIPDQFNWLLEAMATIASETFTSVSAPVQYAAIRAYKGSASIDLYLRHARSVLTVVSEYVYQALCEEKVQMSKAEGGFYLFPNFDAYGEKLKDRGIEDSAAFCEALLDETGIALLPGLAFGRPADEISTRLSFVDFDGGKILDALQSDKIHTSDPNFIKNYCPQITAAMMTLKNWLREL